jgi:hypothetical protein
VDFRAVSDTHRFGIFVPDEDPPGNQVTPRAQKFQLLSHRRQRFARMPTPRKHPGEFVTSRIPPPRPFLFYSSNTACTRSPAKSAGTRGGSLRVFTCTPLHRPQGQVCGTGAGRQFFWLEVDFGKMALPCPTHQRHAPRPRTPALPSRTAVLTARTVAGVPGKSMWGRPQTVRRFAEKVRTW